MKKFVIIFILSLTGFFIARGQAPQSFKYQAVARNISGAVLANQAVAFRMSVLQGSNSGPVVYSERQTLTTNSLGLANMNIGTGTLLSGNFSSIDWGNYSYFLKTELDPAGGTSYLNLGASQLMSVPYALYSENSGNTFTGGTGINVASSIITNTLPNETHTGDATGSSGLTVVKIQGRDIASTIPSNGQALKWNGTTLKWEPATDNGTTYTAGTGINITGTTIANTLPDQTVVMNNGTGISTTGTYPNFTVINTLPNVTHTGDATGGSALTVVKIQGRAVSSAVPTTDQVLKWNGTQWTPSTLSTPSAGWLITGNSGTNPATNFLGTIDNNPLVFRVNNQTAGKIDNFSYNTSLGYKSLNSNINGKSNVAFGSFALYQNTTRSNLVAIGDSALYNNGVGAVGYQAIGNTAVGSKALFANTTGYANTANGFSALYSNNTGIYNTANGLSALYSNTTGSNNTAIGTNTLYSNTTGSSNTASGVAALILNTTGHSNIAIGVSALYKNTTRSNLVAIGDSALYNNGVGAEFYFQAIGNTAVGSKALYSNGPGYDNTAIGVNTLLKNTMGRWNTATGARTLLENTGGSYNTANGLEALNQNTIGNSNTANGAQSLCQNTTGNCNASNGMLSLWKNSTGNYNTACGYEALASNTTGNNNTANGARALVSNTTGYSNVAIGTSALYKNTTHSNLVAIGDSALFHNGEGASAINESTELTAVGSKALYSNTTGFCNTAIGSNSLFSNTTGSYNTANGESALVHNTTGYQNTANGSGAMEYNGTGNYNVADGYAALNQNYSGSWNTAVGYFALNTNMSGNHMTAFGGLTGASTSNQDDGNALGYGAITNANGKTRIGDIWQNTIEGQVGWSTVSDGRFKTNITEDVKGLEFIKRLRPVTYNVESRKLQEFLVKNMPDSVQQRYFEDNKRPAVNPVKQTGFIAQEVEIAAKAVGYDFDGVHIPVDGNDNYSLVYGAFVVPLVKGMQEQQTIIEHLQSKMENAEAMNEELRIANDVLRLKNDEMQKQIDEIKTLLAKSSRD